MTFHSPKKNRVFAQSWWKRAYELMHCPEKEIQASDKNSITSLSTSSTSALYKIPLEEISKKKQENKYILTSNLSIKIIWNTQNSKYKPRYMIS